MLYKLDQQLFPSQIFHKNQHILLYLKHNNPQKRMSSHQVIDNDCEDSILDRKNFSLLIELKYYW